MKFSKNIKLNLFRGAAFLTTIVALLASCTKDNQAPAAAPAGLSVIHVSPGSPEYTFKVNGLKANLKALTYGTVNAYYPLTAGKYEFSITKKDSARIVTKSIYEVKSNVAYSIFVADVPSKAGFVLTEDDLTAPAADKAKIRFINLSPDAGSLDLSITGKTTALFTKTAFKASTLFIPIDPGADMSFEIKDNAGTSALANLSKVKIEKGKIYTVFAKGLKTTSDSTKLSLGVITNK